MGAGARVPGGWGGRLRGPVESAWRHWWAGPNSCIPRLNLSVCSHCTSVLVHTRRNLLPGLYPFPVQLDCQLCQPCYLTRRQLTVLNFSRTLNGCRSLLEAPA